MRLFFWKKISNRNRRRRNRSGEDELMDMYTFFLLLDLLTGQFSDDDSDDGGLENGSHNDDGDDFDGFDNVD